MIVGLGVGLILVGMFLVVQLGIIKSWYIIKTFPGFFSYRMFYGALPLGFGFLILLLASSLPYYNRRYIDIWDILFYLCIILTFWFMFRPPTLLKPKWLQWLEREYGYCLDILIEEAQKMNRWQWEARVRTQEGMQDWIDEVFTHRQAELDQRWMDMRSHLLWTQADSEGKGQVEWGDRIKSYIPEHRQEQEEQRVREELQKLENLRKRKFRGA